MSVPYKYIGTPLEELISLGYYDPEARRVKAIKGRELHVRSLDWQLEGPLRMLFHVLDEEVAKDPKNLVVYGGTGKAARSWEDFEAIASSLVSMDPDDTLVIQSGQPVAIFKLDKRAPRVVMSNAMLVPKWADWRIFRELEGEMGGAQPLAVKMLGGVALIADVDKRMIERRINTAYLDTWTDDIDKAISMALAAKEKKQATSIGVLANAVDLLERLVRDGITPDLLTDQTPAHDPLAYVPQGLSLEEANKLRASDPDKYLALASSSMAKHVQLMLELQRRGAVAFDYGNNLRKQAFDAGVEDAFKIPGQMEFLRPMFEEGRGPFRWISLTGDPNDIYRLDDVLLTLFERNARTPGEGGLPGVRGEGPLWKDG